MTPSHAIDAEPGPARCRSTARLSVATSPVPIQLLGLLLLLTGCAGAPEPFTPGRLDADQMARCRAVAQAFVDGSPDYPELRDALRDDPTEAAWFVRYLELVIVQVREGRAELLGQQTVRADVGERDDLSRRLAAAARAGSGPAEWQLDKQRPEARAADEIVGFGEQAVPILIGDLLLSSQEFLQAIGIELLARIGDPAVPALLDLARNGETAQQRSAARALGEIGATGPALAALRELSRSPTWLVRSDAAQALHKGGAEARTLLIEMLADEDPFVRRKAAETLGHYDDKVSADALIDLLERSQRAEDMPGELAAQKGLQQIAGSTGPRSAAAWRAFAARLAERSTR